MFYEGYKYKICEWKEGEEIYREEQMNLSIV